MTKKSLCLIDVATSPYRCAEEIALALFIISLLSLLVASEVLRAIF